MLNDTFITRQWSDLIRKIVVLCTSSSFPQTDVLVAQCMNFKRTILTKCNCRQCYCFQGLQPKLCANFIIGILNIKSMGEIKDSPKTWKKNNKPQSPLPKESMENLRHPMDCVACRICVSNSVYCVDLRVNIIRTCATICMVIISFAPICRCTSVWCCLTRICTWNKKGNYRQFFWY